MTKLSVEGVKITEAGNGGAVVPNREAFTALNMRLIKTTEEGKITVDAASRAFARYLRENDVDGFEKFVVQIESQERVKQEGQVITNMPERRTIIEEGADVIRSVDEEDEEESQKEKVTQNLNEFYAAPIMPSEINPEIDDRFIPIDLPSACLFYDVPEVRARKLAFSNMKKLSNVLAQNSLDIMVDAIAPCISIDIRKLTQGDFIYFLYWLRTMSLPRTPVEMKWRSRYGTFESMSINLTKLNEKRLVRTDENIEEILASGLDLPRVYDMIAANRFDHEDFDMEDLWTIERVQFFKPKEGETFGERIKRVEDELERDMGPIELIRDFRKKFDHGVNETAQVQADPNTFDPEKAAEYLSDQANKLEAALAVYGFDQKMMEDCADFREEARQITQTLEKGGRVIPRIETIRCEIDALSFFSGI